jgi:hypothetical protein
MGQGERSRLPCKARNSMFQLAEESLRLKEGSVFIADELIISELSKSTTIRKIQGIIYGFHMNCTSPNSLKTWLPTLKKTCMVFYSQSRWILFEVFSSIEEIAALIINSDFLEIVKILTRCCIHVLLIR